MKHSYKVLFNLSLLLIIVFLFFIYHNKTINDNPSTDTLRIVSVDTLYITDTIKLVKPAPYKVEVIKRDTVYKEDKPIELVHEERLYKDSIANDGDTIYSEILLRGIEMEVLEARTILKRKQIERKSEVIITNYATKKGFYIVPNASIGYGMFNHKPDVYVGIGISYRF